MILSGNRHAELLERTVEAMDDFKEAILKLDDAALAAHHLRQCAAAVGEIAGDIVNQEILNTIFTKFCIGK